MSKLDPLTRRVPVQRQAMPLLRAAGPRPRSKSARFGALQRSVDDFVSQNFSPPSAAPIQCALEVSQPGDALEQEADRVAAHVVRGSASGAKADVTTGASTAGVARAHDEDTLQRACSGCSSGSMMDDEEEKPMMQRAAGPQAATASGGAGPGFQSALGSARASGGEALPAPVRSYMEPRFGQSFGDVRLHRDAAANDLADSVHAKAFTIGSDLFFKSGHFDPETEQGQKLIAHELTHVVQQREGMKSVQREILQRQEATESEQGAPKDPMAGTRISEIIISLARGRVGFRTPTGMILGDVTTDLKPGKYELKPDVSKRRWVITGAPSGLRFEVNLEGADPWTLSYPDTLPLLVTEGLKTEPKTFEEMQGPTGELLDPLWLFEGIPEELRLDPVKGIDDYESVHYDLDYRSVNGNLSKFMIVHYRDNTKRDINIDEVTPDTPRLFAAKKDVLRIMDDYNATFILNAFPMLFFVLTMGEGMTRPGAAGAGRTPSKFVVSRQQFSKRGSAPAQGEPAKVPAKGEPAQAPAKGEPPKAPKLDITRDEFSLQGSLPGDPRLRVRVEPGGDVFVATDVFRGSQPKGTGGDLLAQVLREAKFKAGNTLRVGPIENAPTQATFKAGGDAAGSVLGKTAKNALDRLGVNVASMEFKVIRGKLNIVIQTK